MSPLDRLKWAWCTASHPRSLIATPLPLIECQELLTVRATESFDSVGLPSDQLPVCAFTQVVPVRPCRAEISARRWNLLSHWRSFVVAGSSAL